MLKVLKRGASRPETLLTAADLKPVSDVLWVDLIAPTRDEEQMVEAALGVDLPTREEMAAIEPALPERRNHLHDRDPALAARR